ncbi:MAG: RnfABCDGE type electron transport complex subunit D [Clostridiales bacterium]|nr:RnfABCDGE type electron transport complex subunit D [Clostridiales bacterium]
MSDKKMLTASLSPHIKSPKTTTAIMLDVIVALIPSLVAAVFIFGYRALAVTGVTVGTCVISEYISRLVMKRRNTIGDLSAVVTGIILAFNLPSTIPLWMAAFGSLVAIVVVKQMFGGIGQNFVNPAIAARIILMVSFPTAMTASFPNAFAWKNETIDAITSATPLAALKSGGEIPAIRDMLLAKSGSLGEVCAVTLILGGVYLVIRRVISPVIPLFYVGTTAAIMLVYGAVKNENAVMFMLCQILGGGLLLGSIFMATDYATSPISFKGKIIFAIGCGVITSVIRLFGNSAEGVSFSIIIMNILVPHIDRLTTPRPFGTVKEKKHKKASDEKEATA